MRETVLEILKDIRPDIEYEGNEALIDNDELESLDIVALVGELCDEFDVEITVEHLVPENFNSVDAMVNLIESLQD